MTTYITPTIYQYHSIDELFEKNPYTNNYVNKQLSVDNLLDMSFVCIVGEPGVGKSRLLEEIKLSIKNKTILFFCKAYEFDIKKINGNIDYCIIDALDEVDSSNFYHILKAINEFKQNNKSIKVLFSCRKHYVATYASHFAICKDLYYIELQQLSKEQVLKVLETCSKSIQDSVNKGPNLIQLLTIPRYLTFLLEYNEQRNVCENVGELFDFIVYNTIDNAIEQYSNIKSKNKSLQVVIRRTLEKVAFVMEIGRKDHITKDELYSILDGLKGNMSQMVLANLDLLYFESRILKDTQGSLQFENTELQEYLAAKELCRNENIESILYEIAVHKELQHIHHNWYDVIPHISYIADNPNTFINIVQFITSYETNLENEALNALFRYMDTSLLSSQQRKDLFSIVFDVYLQKPVYINWMSDIIYVLQKCYSSNCDAFFKVAFEQLNDIQLTNICFVLEKIVEEGKAGIEIIEYWTNAANNLINSNDINKQIDALYFYRALKDTDNLIRISSKYHELCESVKNTYCDVTGYVKVVDSKVINCWLDGCYKRNPNAINAILYIEDPDTIISTYNTIVEGLKCYEFFNPIGSLCVFYDLYIRKQFDIISKERPDNILLMINIIIEYLNNKSHYTHNEFDTIFRQILLNEDTANYFIDGLEDKWEIELILGHFEHELIDFELISTLDKTLPKTDIAEWVKDNILTNLVNKIRKDESKKESISEYISRYSKTFEQWDNNALKEINIKENDSYLDKEYASLTDNVTPDNLKCNYAYNLCKNNNYWQSKSTEPIIAVITKFFDNLSLDDLAANKKGKNSYTLSYALVYIPYYLKFLHDLDLCDIISKHRILLAKTLPVIVSGAYLDKRELRSIYKKTIGNLSQEEKDELIKWWKSRKDDFMNISYESIIACISDYNMDALSYKIEEYVDDYLNNQDIEHFLPASQSLDLIAKGFCRWNMENFRNIFKKIGNNDDSIKLQSNSIMIEEYGDEASISWRINYFKKNVVKFSHYETGGIRSLSPKEAEITSPNPRMFKCFMSLRNHEYLTDRMFELFDFGLSLCKNTDTQEYSRYIMRQIYNYFINVGDINYIKDLRSKVERNNEEKVNWLAYNIMNNSEMIFLQKENKNINQSIRLYNKCMEDTYLPIRNDGDLRRYFIQIVNEVNMEIQDEGIYSIVRQENLNEDFIQRELKNTIINKCCQMGLTYMRIDREVALQDNKRTDLLFRYGLCSPVMIELKLLNNREIQNEKERRDYKMKFIQYSKATKACFSVFWVFDIKKGNSNREKFAALEKEYKDLDNTILILTDCKCSSGKDTGIPLKETKIQKIINSDI